MIFFINCYWNRITRKRWVYKNATRHIKTLLFYYIQEYYKIYKNTAIYKNETQLEYKIVYKNSMKYIKILLYTRTQRS